MARQEVTLIVRVQDECHAHVRAYSSDALLLTINVEAHHQAAWCEVCHALQKQRVHVALQCPEHWFLQETLTFDQIICCDDAL